MRVPRKRFSARVFQALMCSFSLWSSAAWTFGVFLFSEIEFVKGVSFSHPEDRKGVRFSHTEKYDFGSKAVPGNLPRKREDYVHLECPQAILEPWETRSDSGCESEGSAQAAMPPRKPLGLMSGSGGMGPTNIPGTLPRKPLGLMSGSMGSAPTKPMAEAPEVEALPEYASRFKRSGTPYDLSVLEGHAEVEEFDEDLEELDANDLQDDEANAADIMNASRDRKAQFSQCEFEKLKAEPFGHRLKRLRIRRVKESVISFSSGPIRKIMNNMAALNPFKIRSYKEDDPLYLPPKFNHLIDNGQEDAAFALVPLVQNVVGFLRHRSERLPKDYDATTQSRSYLVALLSQVRAMTYTESTPVKDLAVYGGFVMAMIGFLKAKPSLGAELISLSMFESRNDLSRALSLAKGRLKELFPSQWKASYQNEPGVTLLKKSLTNDFDKSSDAFFRDIGKSQLGKYTFSVVRAMADLEAETLNELPIIYSSVPEMFARMLRSASTLSSNLSPEGLHFRASKDSCRQIFRFILEVSKSSSSSIGMGKVVHFFLEDLSSFQKKKNVEDFFSDHLDDIEDKALKYYNENFQ